MATDKNVPPFDSFEHEHNVPERAVGAGDGLLTSCLNPPKGVDRIGCEQYDTHIWAPGGSGTKCSGESHAAGPVNSEWAKRVPSKLG